MVKKTKKQNLKKFNLWVKQIKKQNLKKVKTKKNNYNVSKSDICNKYKDQSIRTTPKNWAYNKCMRQPKSRLESCKRLPPKGWNMYKYFCE
jgi:hypothetical protein